VVFSAIESIFCFFQQKLDSLTHVSCFQGEAGMAEQSLYDTNEGS